MLPFLDFELFGIFFHLHTNTLLMETFAALSVLFFALSFRSEKMQIRAFFYAIAVTCAAFFGARLFHLVVEQPLDQFRWSQLITRFDGMTFYGALIGGCLIAAAGAWLFFPRSSWGKIADAAAYVSAFGYGILRIGCFANGCCWGRITTLPWAVRYYNNPVMPAWGIPVHPVQLYDSFLGFALGFALMWLAKHRPAFRGKLLPVFVLGYAIGRIFTETFRGDSYRGENKFLWFSTSQSISLVLIVFSVLALMTLLPRKREQHVQA